MFKLFRISAHFTKIRKQDLLERDYQGMIELIRRQYNFQQFKNPSALCLLEMHHQFKIFKQGDQVLDIGAGPYWGWTDLALKLTKTVKPNLVISNDLFPMPASRQRNIFVRGNFLDQPTRTNIAVNLVEKRLNTILVDVSPQYSGDRQIDGGKIADVIEEALNFSDTFLHRGGNFVCKMIEGSSQRSINEYLSTMFHQVFRYVPTILRPTSPIFYFVAKGYMMNQSYYALVQFMKEYKGSVQKKIKIVQKYQNKYNWNPRNIIKKIVVERISTMKKQGRSDKDILKIFEGDPFAKASQILQEFRNLQIAESEKNPIKKLKTLSKITGRNYVQQLDKTPQTLQQFAEMLLKKPEKQKTDIEKKKEKNRKPLQDNEVYMKNIFEKQTDKIQKIYIQEDLHDPSCMINDQQLKQRIEKDQQKFFKAYPDLKTNFDEISNLLKQDNQIRPQNILDSIKQQDQQNNKENQDQYYRNAKIDEMESASESSSIDTQSRKQFKNSQTPKIKRYINQKRSLKNKKY